MPQHYRAQNVETRGDKPGHRYHGNQYAGGGKGGGNYDPDKRNKELKSGPLISTKRAGGEGGKPPADLVKKFGPAGHPTGVKPQNLNKYRTIEAGGKKYGVDDSGNLMPGGKGVSEAKFARQTAKGSKVTTSAEDSEMRKSLKYSDGMDEYRYERGGGADHLAALTQAKAFEKASESTFKKSGREAANPRHT